MFVTVLLALLALETVISAIDGESDWVFVRLIPAFIAIGLLPWRRWKPLLTATIAFVFEGGFEIAGAISDVNFDTTFAHGVAGIALFYALCRWSTIQQMIAGSLLLASLGIAGSLANGSTVLDSVAFLIPWGVVLSFALSMRYRARLVEQQYAQVRLEERHALARELHDAVAHHVSAIAVQAQAAQFVSASNPTAAAEAMRSVEEIAATAIDEMRRMVGILRSDGDQTRSVAPTSLTDLVDAPGRPEVTLAGDADLSGLSAPVATAVFRIAQEAITNARRHSRDGTFIDVTITTGPEAVEFSVVNDGTPITRNSGSGYGLVGMRERIEALGGTLTSAARPTTGWTVDAHIPVRRAPDRAEQ